MRLCVARARVEGGFCPGFIHALVQTVRKSSRTTEGYSIADFVFLRNVSLPIGSMIALIDLDSATKPAGSSHGARRGRHDAHVVLPSQSVQLQGKWLYSAETLDLINAMCFCYFCCAVRERCGGRCGTAPATRLTAKTTSLA